MTDTQENLGLVYEKAQEALKASDVDQALLISENGLKKAELDNDDEWIQKFDSLQSQLKSNSLTPSIIKEDITVIKGIGPSVAEKIKDLGINSMRKLANSTPAQLSQVRGIGPVMAKKIIEEAGTQISTSTLDKYSSNNQPTQDHLQSTINVEDIPTEGEEAPSEKEKDTWSGNKLNETQAEEWQTPLNGKETFSSSLDIEEFEDISDDVEYDDNQELEDFNFRPETISTKEILKSEVALPKVRETSEISEVLSHAEVENLSDNIRKELRANDFLILNRVQQLKDVYTKINILALKTIQINEFLETICIVPIKVCTFKGSLIVSENKIDYKPVNQNQRKKNYENLQRYARILTRAYENLSDDITNEGNFLSFLNKYFKLNLSLEKTLTHKNLFFHSGPRQFNFLIEPLIVTKNRVGFTEKSLPFPYQQNNNIHVVDISSFSNLLSYLERKIPIVETHIEQKNSIKLKEKAATTFMNNLRKLSVPFIGLGLVFLSIFLFQGYSFLQVFINGIYGAYFVYAIMFGYLYISYYTKIRKIRQDFSMPYYKRKLKLDDTSLVLISEQLSPTLMEQFAYECLEKDNKSKIVDQIEQENVQNYLHEKLIEKKVKNAKLFEENYTHDDKVEDKSMKDRNSGDNSTGKYSFFLED